MSKNKIVLPNVISEDCWFYEANKDKLEKFKGIPYISYSSVSSWEEYRADYIKEKFAKIKLPQGIYASLGNYLGEAIQHGYFAKENPHGFTGQENLQLIERPEGALYERFIVIDRGDYIIIGFIDIFHEYEPKVVKARDLKTGGSKKEETYKKPEYIQVVLYAHALEQEGYTIGKTDVWFVRRTGSHIKPPLHISSEQFSIDLEYTPERVQYALDKVDRVVHEISDLYKVYKKYFL